MSNFIIKPIDSKKDKKAFVLFTQEVYKNNTNWVQPLTMDIMPKLDTKTHPFFLNGSMQLFMAYQVSDNKIVGRIAAITNKAHNDVHNDNVGFFGFFECINNQEVANLLFDTAAKWLKNRNYSSMQGPASPSSNYEYGLLTEGFDDPPRLMMSYNPPYYQNLIENYGFDIAKKLVAYRLVRERSLSNEKIVRVAKLARERAGLQIRQANLKNLKEEVKNIKEIYNKAWALNWGFVPLSDAEIDAMAKELGMLADKEFVLFGYINDQLVGFALAMRDYNFIIKQMNGNLFPFNFLKIFTQKNKIKWSRVITLGILPEYQRKGLDAVFYYELLKGAEKLGIELAEASWILEDNLMMNRGAIALEGEIYKRYNVYDKEL